jgi:uncharacterized membrane protein YraQ (UPF0718 family)
VRFTSKPEASHRSKVIGKAQVCGCSDLVSISIETQAPAYIKDNFNSPQECCVQLCCTSSDSLRYNDKALYFNFMLLSIAGNIGSKLYEYFKIIPFFLLRIKWQEIGRALINTGVKQILFYYSIFVAVGFLINHFVPASIIVTLFSAKNIFAVPLAALIGLPIYVNGESALPLIQTLMTNGAGGGAMLAFLITGPGTSAGVITGIAMIMKKRAILLYVTFLLVGGILLGYLYDFLLAVGM